MFYSKSCVFLVCRPLAFLYSPSNTFQTWQSCFHHLPCIVAVSFPCPRLLFLCTGYFIEKQNHQIFWFIRDLCRSWSLIPSPASLQSCSPDSHPQPAIVHGVVLPHVQDLARGSAELHKIPVSPFLHHVQVFLEVFPKGGFPSNLQSTRGWKRSLAICCLATDNLKGILQTSTGVGVRVITCSLI